jgi:hypothetical protein
MHSGRLKGADNTFRVALGEYEKILQGYPLLFCIVNHVLTLISAIGRFTMRALSVSVSGPESRLAMVYGSSRRQVFDDGGSKAMEFDAGRRGDVIVCGFDNGFEMDLRWGTDLGKVLPFVTYSTVSQATAARATPHHTRGWCRSRRQPTCC